MILDKQTQYYIYFGLFVSLLTWIIFKLYYPYPYFTYDSYLTVQLCNCIREFKEKSKVDKVVVLWTANTERYSDVIVGLNDTQENLFKSLDRDESEISPSTLYALACIHENVPFINGSPQNTFVPGKEKTIFMHLHK